MDEADLEVIKTLRREIEDTASRLSELYGRRVVLMVEMQRREMTTREIGALWGISQPAVLTTLQRYRGSRGQTSNS